MRRLSSERTEWIARHILPHEPALRAHLSRWRLPNDLDADDVIQEAYGRLAAMESVAGVANPRNFLFTVARNLIASHVRHSRVISIRAVDDLDALGLAANDPSPEIQVSDRQQLQMLATAVAELPEPGRKAFLMRVMDEMPHRDIGKQLGLSENAVQKSIAKSLNLLLTRLGRGGNGGSRASKTSEEPGGENGTRGQHGD